MLTTNSLTLSAVQLSRHAEVRCRQRGISTSAMELVLDFGSRIYSGGALFCFMADKDMPGQIPPQVQERLRGITLILNLQNYEVMTVYRNRKALREIKRKDRKWYHKEAA